MKTIVFTLCDGAYNYDGRLTVVGTYDIIRMQSIPGQFNANFALKFLIPDAELSPAAVIKIEFKDANNNPIADTLKKSVPFPENRTGHIHLAMAGSAQLNVAEAGNYKMICYIDDCQVEELDFSIMLR